MAESRGLFGHHFRHDKTEDTSDDAPPPQTDDYGYDNDKPSSGPSYGAQKQPSDYASYNDDTKASSGYGYGDDKCKPSSDSGYSDDKPSSDYGLYNDNKKTSEYDNVKTSSSGYGYGDEKKSFSYEYGDIDDSKAPSVYGYGEERKSSGFGYGDDANKTSSGDGYGDDKKPSSGSDYGDVKTGASYGEKKKKGATGYGEESYEDEDKKGAYGREFGEEEKRIGGYGYGEEKVSDECAGGYGEKKKGGYGDEDQQASYTESYGNEDDAQEKARKEVQESKDKQHLGEMGSLAAGAFALYERHEAKTEPQHGGRHKIEEEIAGVVAAGSGGYAFHEHQKKEEYEGEVKDKNDGEEKKHHFFG